MKWQLIKRIFAIVIFTVFIFMQNVKLPAMIARMIFIAKVVIVNVDLMRRREKNDEIN